MIATVLQVGLTWAITREFEKRLMWLLLAVLLFGQVGKGAQRWLDLGLLRFQPSELVKITVPLMIAWFR